MTEERILDKVRKLLDRAEHPNTPEPERELCIRQADKLMFKYAIDQAILDSHRTGKEKRTPVTRRFHAADRSSEWWNKFTTMMYELQQTTRVRVAAHYDGDVTVVGMMEDVDYYEMIWTTIYLAFVSKLFPKWDSTLAFEHNVYNYKKAGYKWQAIADLSGASLGMMKPAYLRWCKMIGEDPQNHTQRHDAYRESFAEGFVRTVCARLESLREDREETASQGSNALVLLKDVQAHVDEAFYEVFPDLRPMSDEELAARREQRRREQQEAAQKRQEMLDAMTERQRQTFFRKEEEERRKNAKANDRYWRQQQREADSRYDSHGMQQGQRAGESVDLGGRKRVGGGSKGEIQ